MKKVISLILMAAIFCGMATGCSKGKVAEKDGKVCVYDGTWPDETNADAVKQEEKNRDDFQKENPDIVIEPEPGNYLSAQVYVAKANAKQLPTYTYLSFPDIKQYAAAGYLRDISDIMKKQGLDDAMNDELRDIISYDGKIYALPKDAYMQGLEINLNLFKKAGLIDASGRPKVPDTWQELAGTAKTIKEKTGRAGFVIPTLQGNGGWYFLNIAWAYGVDFMKRNNDGSYTATFDSPEMREAVQYMYDLKWKYNALPDDTNIDRKTMESLFAADEAAMMIADPPTNSLTTLYGMNIDSIYATRIPAGPAGRFSQMGGGAVGFSVDATDKQVEASLAWMKFRGHSTTPDINEETKERLINWYKEQVKNKYIILPEAPMSVWKVGSRYEEDMKLRKQYTNVNPKNYEEYFKSEGVTIRPEEPACGKQLYVVLNDLLQAIINNKDADIDKLVETANHDFQVNHLDKMD